MERNRMENILKEIDELKLRISLLEQLLELKQKIMSLETELEAIGTPQRVNYIPIGKIIYSWNSNASDWKGDPNSSWSQKTTNATTKPSSTH